MVANAIAGLAAAIDSFSPAELNSIPFKGSWTAGQVTVHVLKSIEGFPKLLAAGAVPTERDPHQFEEEFKKIFLDFNTKMQSPDFILPGQGPFDKQELLDRLLAIGQKIGDASRDIDLSQTFTHFSFPGIGALTGYELLCFAFCHVTRHTRQVENIHATMRKTISTDKQIQ